MGTHHILRDGTSYSVTGGTTLRNGVKYQIGGGGRRSMGPHMRSHSRQKK